MKYFSLLLVLTMLTLTGCIHTTYIDFEDLSSVTTGSPPKKVNVGDSFTVGTILIENKTGVEFVVLPFYYGSGTITYGGRIEVVQDGLSGGSGNEIHFNNACLGMVIPSNRLIKKVKVKFGEHGGNINLMENGLVHNEDDFSDISSLGLVTNVFGGHPLGTLELIGNMNAFYHNFPPPPPGPPPPPVLPLKMYSGVIVGGQELWIDDIELTR